MASIDYILLAEYATETGPTLTLDGAGVNTFFARSFPVHVPFVIVFGVVIPWSEIHQTHPISLEIIDPDGNALGPSFTAEAWAAPDGGTPDGSTFVRIYHAPAHPEIQRPGSHAVVARVGTTEHRRVEFHVLLETES